jgi:pimeloyl-ACP methyl ester carboxylesterase
VAELYGIDPDDVPGALGQADELLRGRDLRPELGRVRVPTLVLAGGRDPLVAAEDTAAIAAAIPGAELVTVPHAAHSVLAEGGGPLLARVIGFLEGGE